MQLEYRILWFEDQPRNVAPMRDNIQDGLEDLGFLPRIDIRQVVSGGPDPLADLPEQRDVDLVLMDWQLGNLDGAQLSRRVRRVFEYTDIVFYSAVDAKHLRKLIFDQDIDGVHCCQRMNLSENTLGIIRTQMHKVLDLNHMRGIVMATTSDLEHAMIECLGLIQPVAYPDAQEFAGVISKRVSEELRKKAEKIEEIGRKKSKFRKLIEDPNFNAALRLEMLQSELAKLQKKEHEPHLEKLASYLREVITPRNDFAHRRAEVVGGELRLKGRSDAFTQETMIALRLRLLDHKSNLGSLLELLRAAAGDLVDDDDLDDAGPD